MAKDLRFIYQTKNQNGVVLVLIAVLLIVFLGFAALAVDVGHIVVVRNELKNAADGGALAGARFLYREDSTVPYGIALDIVEANAKALSTALANQSDKLPVEVDGGDIQIGHWSFGMGTLAKGFYLPDGPPIFDIWNYPTSSCS